MARAIRVPVFLIAFILSGTSATMRGEEAARPSIEARLTALERRVAHLERENRELRAQTANHAAPAGHPAQEAADASALAVAQPASPATPQDEKPAVTVNAPPLPAAEKAKRERFEFGGQIRFRPEVRQNLDLDSSNSDARNFVGQRLRFQVRARVDENVEAFVQLQDSRLWGEEQSVTSRDGFTDLHQGYLQVEDFLKPGVSLRVGRQELIYGGERLVGAFGWDNVGRSFDALKLGYATKTWWTDFLLAKTIDRRSTGRGDRDQYLYGVYSRFFADRPQYLEIYGLHFRDGLRLPGELVARGPSATEIFTLGARSAGTFGDGYDYELEFANQFGHRAADSHRARAFAGRLNRTLDEKLKLRVGFEYDVASGDSDPADGRSGEFFNLFPTNHPLYGYADLMGWRNMQDFRPHFSFTPVGPLSFDVDYHRFYLLQGRGPWKNAGGVVFGFDPTGQSGKHVGDELDFTAAFPLQKHLKILSGYSIFWPGEFARRTRGPDKQHFFYLQTLLNF
jgi:hypothetical protein